MKYRPIYDFSLWITKLKRGRHTSIHQSVIKFPNSIIKYFELGCEVISVYYYTGTEYNYFFWRFDKYWAEVHPTTDAPRPISNITLSYLSKRQYFIVKTLQLQWMFGERNMMHLKGASYWLWWERLWTYDKKNTPKIPPFPHTHAFHGRRSNDEQTTCFWSYPHELYYLHQLAVPQ